MSLWDYHPFIGPIREANGTATDGGGSAGDLRNDPNFDYSFACGKCEAPISEMDNMCPACGEQVEWDKAPTWEC